MTQISVVVAIYGVEKYLEKCLDSIINQTYRDIEIILVDDGSPDMCPQICDRYAKLDSRVEVIHQANRGSICARATGAAIATGEYISFVDGDDWLQDNMYAVMAALAERNHADIVVTGYYQGVEGNLEKRRNSIDSGVYSGENLIGVKSQALYCGKFYEPGIVPAFWNKLFRRELLGDVFESVNPIIRMGEDAAVTYTLFNRAKIVVLNNEECLYCYRESPNSMSKQFDEKYFDRANALISGLYSCLGHSVFENQIIYYAMFIYKIGIEQAIGPNRKVRLVKRMRILKNSVDSFNLLIDNSDIEWEGVNKYDYDLICSYCKCSIFRMLCVFYKHLIWKD